MRILWAKSGGFLPLDTGGKIRSFNIARELARRHDVTLFTFYPKLTPDPHEQLAEPFCQVERMPITVPERASVVDTIAYAANALTNRPYQMRKYCRPEAGRRLKQLVLHKKYDAILCDYLLTAGVLPWTSGIPTVIFTHNVEAILWRRRLMSAPHALWKLVAWREYRTIARAERYFTGLADHVLTVSDDDRKVFLEYLAPDTVSTVPTGVDVNYFRPARPVETPSLVFTGSMDWSPNEDAILYFAAEILPLIRKQLPATTLSVVGRTPTAKLLDLASRHPAIRVTGTVDDIRPYVHDASVYVVPLRVGGGTRIKIFEAMAMGKAIVSTSLGAEGLPVRNGQNIILADTPAEFAKRTLDLLRSASERDRLGHAARGLVEDAYDWPAVTNVVEDAVKRVSTQPQ